MNKSKRSGAESVPHDEKMRRASVRRPRRGQRDVFIAFC
jgi:hypothetical protein